MDTWLKRVRKGIGKKLASIHRWNAWMIVFLAVSGLILPWGAWREILGAGRVWLKWLHVGVGLALLLPVLYYLLLAGKHWSLLKGRPAQKWNVFIVLFIMAGWILSGVVLWQFRAFGPSWSNPALTIHDTFTWIGLPYIIYHSLTRTRWLKEPHRRTVRNDINIQTEASPVSTEPLYTRRAFIRSAIGLGFAVTLGPSFIKWLSSSLSSSGNVEELVQKDGNHLLPAPQPAAESLPPVGGGSQGSFRIYTVTPIPSFNNSNWSFTVDGLVNKTLKWNWEEFVKLPRSVQVSNFHCVTGWSVYNNTWEGIPLKQLLDQAGVQSSAQTVKFYSGDGEYTDSLTMEQAQMKDIMIAVMLDGKPIPSDLGGPVRLVVPQMYTYKSVKWLNRIELIAEDHIGYWEARGYDKDAWLPSTKRS
ncbi:molybdopterin-dependent oxidoreductase [Paenibacillus sp. HJL G12]|uniref:Molybdopterin-dependent oxidoreductase n=1 Tax=Paenibacillus dendrobii TaxID=2691084 RepID=A0A7X3LJW6_9BACL|nr:molybdopterin-dependent oxidoreductase [Paenibacillus dendrobii]MWV46700.1 molybdopterin-dependent oxidoreductase [Paenibacillus dendrobii]